MADVPAEGIEHISATDFAYAREFGFTIKLLATARLHGGALSLGVRPTLVPQGTPLSTIRGAFNAVEVRSFALGPALLVGQGAGALPTGSAVVSDIIEAGRNLGSRAGGRVPHFAWAGGVHAATLAPPLQPARRVVPALLRRPMSRACSRRSPEPSARVASASRRSFSASMAASLGR